MIFIAINRHTKSSISEYSPRLLGIRMWGLDVAEHQFAVKIDDAVYYFDQNPPIEIGELTEWLKAQADKYANTEPSGISSKVEWLLAREKEIYAAMRRYVAANKVIPVEWIDELEELNLP